MPSPLKSADKGRFKSELFETVTELRQALYNVVAYNSDRRKRLAEIRNFSNGLALMTQEEAEKLGRKEITNHLMNYGKLLNQETMFSSMVSGVHDLLEILVDTNEPEKDLVTSARFSKIVNQHALAHLGMFSGLWEQIAGELVMAGGVPILHPAAFGWLPTAALDMLFPKDTPLSATGVTYAFNPVELSLRDLRKLKKAAESEGSNLDLKTIQGLIDGLNEEIKTQTTSTSHLSADITKASRTNSDMPSVTVPCWEYYEVKPYENESDYEGYVSKTLFFDATQSANRFSAPELDDLNVLAYFDTAYKNSAAWLQYVAVDAEIGGKKQVESLRGVAELIYPSGTEMESLLNLLLEGDKIRSRPKIRITGNANPDDIARWNIERDLFAPEGVEEMEFKTNNQHLQTPIGMLNQTSSLVAGGPMSNSPKGGELLRQTVERQESNQGIQSKRLNTAYVYLDLILNVIVWRICQAEIRPGTTGYMDIMAVRELLEADGIDFKDLTTQRFGRFTKIRVRAKRVVGAGDRQAQLETSDWLMTQLPSIEPATRSIVLRQAIMLRTQDPDLADSIVRPPTVILSQQRVTAENEYDTMRRRAVIGFALSPQPGDIHHEHLDTHFIDLQALLGAGEVTPWTQLDAMTFAAVIQHVGEHLQVIMGNPQTNFEASKYLQTYQAIVQAAKPLMAQAQEAMQQKEGLSPKEQADIELKLAKLELDARALGVKEEDLKDLQRIRASRAEVSKRSQYTKEISDADRRSLERARVMKELEQPTKPTP